MWPDGLYVVSQVMMMATGRVKWFDVKKGFGFILNAENADVFVHFKSIEDEGFRSLKEGELVQFEQAEGDKVLYAHRVVRITRAARATQEAPAAHETRTE